MKVLIKKILLNLNLYSVFERVYFLIKKFSYRKKNRKFLSQESGITIPPDFYMYETFNLDYEKFINGGKDVAKSMFKNNSQLFIDSIENHLTILP